jgi:signal transduction histidine kinase/CheY-like chemotaxis protein
VTPTALSPEQLHQDTLREYQWLATHEDRSFDGLLHALQALTGAVAVGISVRGLDAVAYKAVLGADNLLDGRSLKHCEEVIREGQAIIRNPYAGLPLQTKEGLVFGTLWMLCQEGSWTEASERTLQSIAEPILSILDARRAVVKLHEARSELHLKVKALAETKRLHRDFISHLSHEMRTPLHAIQGLTELMQDDAHHAHQPRLLANLAKSSQHMLETLNVILDHAKLEAGALRLSPSTFAFKDFLHEALMPFESLIESRGITFVKSIAVADDAMCTTDRVRLRQVLYNLISNALKFTEKGSIRVEVKEEDEGEALANDPSADTRLFAFRIIDTGLGIHRFNHGLLFEPYRQVSGDTNRGGSGLGLNICKRIVESMNGQIGVESDFGEGSTFWFKIPLPISSARKTLAPVALVANASLNDSSEPREGLVLVIEDNTITRTVTTRTLEQNGFRTRSVETLNEGLALLDEHVFDALLLDLHIGDIAPATLLREVRALSPAPIIVISGSAISPHETAGHAIDEALQKPYTRDALIEAVDYWTLSKSQSDRLVEGWKKSLESLEKTCGPVFLHRTINGFVHRHPAEIQKLRRDLDEENWDKLELGAHSMKSTLATLGLMDLNRLIVEIEGVALTRDRARLESLLKSFQIDARRTYTHLLSYVRRMYPIVSCEIAS